MRHRTSTACVGLVLLACLPVVTGAAPSARDRASTRVETPGTRVARGWNAPANASNFASHVASLGIARSALTAPPNDQCAGALTIPCGNIDLSGDTFLATNDYTFSGDTANACTKHTADGRDVVYKLVVQPGDSLILTYSSQVFDPSIYLVSDCASVQDSCVAGADENQLGVDEQLNYGFKRAGTYYLILDSWGPDTYGTWSLAGRFWSCGLTTPAGDICATATSINCGQSAWSGNTATALNDYSFASPGTSCTNSLADGKDVTYKLTMTAGDSLAVSYTSSADGVLYLLSDCSTTSSCLAGSDATGAGGAETLNYRFQFSGTYFLVLDSNGANTSGSWSMITTLICINQPPINDLCEGAFPLVCGQPISLSGTTALANNDYSLLEAGCTGATSAGPDVVYRIDAHKGDQLSIQYGFPYNIQPNPLEAPDAVIYLATDCSNLAATCLIGKDATVDGGIETLNYTFPLSLTYYLILDSYTPGFTGKWQAVGTLACGPPLAVGDPPGAQFRLGEPAPNPFVSFSTVRFALAARGHATLRVYDLAGRAVRTLVNGDLDAGDHSTMWNARDDAGLPVRAGVYYARLVSAGHTGVRTLILVH